LADNDPYTQIHDAIWAILEGHTDFAALVAVGNRIKFSDTSNVKDPIKDNAQAADLPEVRVICESIRPHLQRTSNTTTAVATWSIQVSSGDLRFQAALFPVLWAIYRAMSTWKDTFDTLTWNSEQFALPLRPQEARIGVNESDLIRGIRGWASVWSSEVEMFFRTIDMQA